MAFSPQFLDEIRARVALSDVIGRRVKLTRRGREHVGLCPFHNEKTPSFTVNEDKGFFHCFGCGAHGDVIGFSMRMDGLSFPEAVERLASGSGLEIPTTSPEDRVRADRRRSLHTLTEAACAWFEHQLRLPGGAGARAYLAGRSLDDDTIARFRIGFAPRDGDCLRAALAAKGFETDAMIEAGLLGRPDDGRAPYGRFRGRIMFPITDRRGRPIAFGGRALGDVEPKYLNSPETPLFTKGSVLYGLAQAVHAARESGEVVVAEGYMDVIALHRAGIEAAVAPLGTALTEAQIELLWRLAAEPVLCFDGDDAGRRAAHRAVGRALPLLRPGKSLRFAFLPQGEDPDSLLRAGGRAALGSALSRAQPLGDLLWTIETAGKAADTPERRAQIRNDLLRRVFEIADRTVQEYYRDDMAARLDAAFRSRGPRARGRARGRAGAERGARISADGNLDGLDLNVRRGFLAALINHPELLEDLGEELGSHSFGGADLDGLRQKMVEIGEFDLDSGAFKSHLQEHGFSDLLTRVLSREVYAAAPFARPDKSAAETKREWQDVWRRYWMRRARGELAEDMDALARDMTAERWGRVDAKRRQVRDSRTLDDSLIMEERTKRA